jgi:glutaconate CoA-transferase, subunit B
VSAELMVVAAARLLRAGQLVVAPGGLPSAVARLAAEVHGVTAVAPDDFDELGAWMPSGRVDAGVLTADQVDVTGNLGATVLGEYDEPVRRLAGAGWSSAVAAGSAQVVVVVAHRLAAFVERVDFVTVPGSPDAVVTDLGVLRPDPATGDLVLTDLHPGVTVEQVRAETGWPLEVADELVRTPAPTDRERSVLAGSAA